MKVISRKKTVTPDDDNHVMRIILTPSNEDVSFVFAENKIAIIKKDGDYEITIEPEDILKLMKWLTGQYEHLRRTIKHNEKLIDWSLNDMEFLESLQGQSFTPSLLEEYKINLQQIDSQLLQCHDGPELLELQNARSVLLEKMREEEGQEVKFNIAKHDAMKLLKKRIEFDENAYKEDHKNIDNQKIVDLIKKLSKVDNIKTQLPICTYANVDPDDVNELTQTELNLLEWIIKQSTV